MFGRRLVGRGGRCSDDWSWVKVAVGCVVRWRRALDAATHVAEDGRSHGFAPVYIESGLRTSPLWQPLVGILDHEIVAFSGGVPDACSNQAPLPPVHQSNKLLFRDCFPEGLTRYVQTSPGIRECFGIERSKTFLPAPDLTCPLPGCVLSIFFCIPRCRSAQNKKVIHPRPDKLDLLFG